jgi:hypothetical protein
MRSERSPLPTSRRRDSACSDCCRGIRGASSSLPAAAHGLGPVLVLGALVLALHHDARGQVGDADGGVGLVDVLAAGAGGPVGVDAQVALLSRSRCRRCPRLRHHGDRAGGGVDAPLGLGLRHPLHPVGAGLELEPAVDVPPSMRLMISLKPPCSPGALAEHLHFQPLALRVAAVHAEQVSGEDRGLVAAGAGADFEEHVRRVVRVARQEQRLQPLTARVQCGLRCAASSCASARIPGPGPGELAASPSSACSASTAR